MKTATKISSVDMGARKSLDIRAGDTVRVHQKIKEGDKTRLQVFEGLVLARKHGSEVGGTFTVRKVASGVGVERIFPLYSPAIDKIDLVKRVKVRRAKLYHIRDKATKEISRELRRELTIKAGITPKAEVVEAETEASEAPVAEEKTA